MFASHAKKVVTLQDGDTSVSVTIHKLSAKSLTMAEEIRAATAIKAVAGYSALFKEVVTPEISSAIKDAQAAQAAKKAAGETAADEREAVYSQYDRDHVLRAGIESWTSSVPVSTGVDDLDEDAAVLLFHEIMDLSVPPKAVAEAAAKND